MLDRVAGSAGCGGLDNALEQFGEDLRVFCGNSYVQPLLDGRQRGRGSRELPARIWALGRGCDFGNGAISRGHAPKLESKAMKLGRGPA